MLGAVLAGGKSSRFGSDKAQALVGGGTLLDNATGQLTACGADPVVVVGRDGGIADWPKPGHGPLGGLAAALRHARVLGLDTVLTCGVDSLGLPADLVALLGPAPAIVASQPVIGLWPVSCLPQLEDLIAGDGHPGLYVFAETIGARPVELANAPGNINTKDDLGQYLAAQLPQR